MGLQKPDPLDALAPLERALTAHQRGASRQMLLVHTDRDELQRMPVALFFREGARLRAADRRAIALCQGRVLDVGAGAGAIALALQGEGFEVTALEVLPEAVQVMQGRGVLDARLADVRTFTPDQPYDTVLALMNGTAPAGTLAGLAPWLAALCAPCAEGGQLLVDSTDLREPGRRATRDDGRYVGELQYQLEYDGERGPPFLQLFVDPLRLRKAAKEVGLTSALVWRGAGGAYLSRLTRA
ncbi:MAG: methyltransferase [Gemmatimonadetes bacterium]|nr:methyltransferase [Gemmatimonadota bacterium]